MLLAGLARGLYSLRGRKAGNPLAQTASNFARSAPLALALSLVAFQALHVDPRGLLLALLSGALASGIGYIIWYQALASLSGIAASAVQLAVPVLAAGGGVLLLAEQITLRLGVAALFVLGGVALTLFARTSGRQAGGRSSSG